MCESYFKECEGLDQEPTAPYWRKWKPYAEMFAAFYPDDANVDFTEDEPWTFFEMPEISVVVAGLNSTMAESHRDEDHYGLVGEGQLRWFRERLARYEGWLRIGAVHHNPVRGATDDDENLRDVGDLDRILGPSLHALLHGHTHDGKLQWTAGRVPILATGSAALAREARPHDGEVSNQYQLIRFDAGSFCRWCRQYAPDRKTWQGDNRASASGNEWWDEQVCSFADALAPEGPARAEVRDFGERVRDDLLARVEDVCRLREGVDVEIRRISGTPDFLRVTQREGTIFRSYPLTAVEDMTSEAFDALLRVHRRYRQSDSGVVSVLVYGGEPPADEIVRRARDERVRLASFVEYQGLIDFRVYLEEQTRKLSNDRIYPPDLYVEQRLRYMFGEEEQEEDALATVRDWLFDDRGRFVLVLGNFGTGKTFLLRELARRLGEEGGPVVPILIELRALEKAHDLDVLVAQHLARSGMGEPPDKFRYMLKEGRVALLFDGFDELALRVSYDRAVEHFSTLTAAADSNAKVVVTSRTQHFESDRQVRTSLGEKVELFVGSRIVYLQGFDERRIRTFLVHQLRDETSAGERFTLLGEVRDLMGLSENPRMLGFISEAGKETARFIGHRSSVKSVCFSPDGSRLASGSYDNTVHLWDVASGRCLAVLVHLVEGWVAYTPEGRYRLGGETSGGFWHTIGLCRFEPGELDPYLDEPLRVPDGEPLF